MLYDIEYRKNKRAFLTNKNSDKIIKEIFNFVLKTLNEIYPLLEVKEEDVVYCLKYKDEEELKEYIIKIVTDNKYNMSEVIEKFGNEYYVDYIIPLTKFKQYCVDNVELVCDYINIQICKKNDNTLNGQRKSGSSVIKPDNIIKIPDMSYNGPYWV